jgi:hypothetical protein
MVNFYISSNEKLRNSEYRDSLKQLLIDLCDRYTGCVQLSDTNDTTIDDICHQSLFFLQASNDELAVIIGSDKVIKNNCEDKDSENSELSYFQYNINIIIVFKFYVDIENEKKIQI